MLLLFDQVGLRKAAFGWHRKISVSLAGFSTSSDVVSKSEIFSVGVSFA